MTSFYPGNLAVYVLEPTPKGSRYKGHVLRVEGGPAVHYFSRRWSKRAAISDAAGKIEGLATVLEQPSELKIRRRDGTFEPARTYPRSADPKRSRG